MAEFVNDCQANLFADFGIVVAYGFDILLIKNDVVRSRGKVKRALFRSGQTVKKAQKQLPLLLTADLAENPPREQRRYACDCGIGVEASRVFPRLP